MNITLSITALVIIGFIIWVLYGLILYGAAKLLARNGYGVSRCYTNSSGKRCYVFPKRVRVYLFIMNLPVSIMLTIICLPYWFMVNVVLKNKI